MWSNIVIQDPVKHVRNESNEAEKLISAVRNNDPKMVLELLEKVDVDSRITFCNGVTIDSKPLLHFAAFNGYLEMVNTLLSVGINPSFTNHTGRTALHESVRAGQITTTAALLENVKQWDETDGLRLKGRTLLAFDGIATLAQTGALVNMQDPTGLTPLLILADTSTIPVEDFEKLVEMLIWAGGDVNKHHPVSGQTALYRAVELKSLRACQLLIEAGTQVDRKDHIGETVIHVVCRLGYDEILQYLILCSRESINEKNIRGDTALHCAAIGGSRECITTLLNRGADLSIENLEEQSALEAICSNLHRPKSFLIETLDSKIIPNQCSINDRQFELTMDFRILTPDRQRQMTVVIAFMNALNPIDRRSILQHPLIDTFLRFKWTQMRFLFFVFVFIHLMFVISLSAHVIWLLYPDDRSGNEWTRRILLVTATFLIFHVVAQTLLAPKYFLYETETWLSLTCVCSAFVMSVSGEIIPNPSGSEWIRHVASYTVLLSWFQVLFILGRFPSIGFFALMFFTVFKNVLKAILIFACIVIGFSLSFCVQFNYFEYEGPWRAFIRTIVMMMGEYEFQNLFNENIDISNRRWMDKPSSLVFTSQIIFLLFILLGSVVLVNLMIGLAVSDIQGLQEEGNLRHLIKQAEFLMHIDRIGVYCRMPGRTSIPSAVTFNPSTINKVRESNFRRLGLSIPTEMIEELVSIALRNQKRDNEISDFGLRFTKRVSRKRRPEACDVGINT